MHMTYVWSGSSSPSKAFRSLQPQASRLLQWRSQMLWNMNKPFILCPFWIHDLQKPWEIHLYRCLKSVSFRHWIMLQWTNMATKEAHNRIKEDSRRIPVYKVNVKGRFWDSGPFCLWCGLPASTELLQQCCGCFSPYLYCLALGLIVLDNCDQSLYSLWLEKECEYLLPLKRFLSRMARHFLSCNVVILFLIFIIFKVKWN